MESYDPKPIDTSGILIPNEIVELTERLAENIHENWSAQRMKEGWQFGPRRDDVKRMHPCLLPYKDLPENEKEYDRITAIETIKMIIAIGYRIIKD
jgi:hypothetical protein